MQIYTFSQNGNDYISLTDIARYKDKERTDYIIQNWMRTRDTIDFLGIWERINNPHFKHIEFDGFKNHAGSNSFSLTPKRWIESVNTIGIINKAGRYGGGTFTHKDQLQNSYRRYTGEHCFFQHPPTPLGHPLLEGGSLLKKIHGFSE